MACFIIDTCADVVDGQKEYLGQFFHDVWALNGWQIVIGGATMSAQIQRKEALNGLISNLKDVGRAITIASDTVDRKEADIRERIIDRLGGVPESCDDLHILALALVANCRNVITKDHRLSACVNSIRAAVGHDHCPRIRVISSAKTYGDLKRRNQL